MKKKYRPKILCVGDSLGRPRGRPSVVGYEQTWVSLLELEFPEYSFIRNFVPTKQSKDIVAEFPNDIECYQPDLVILQVGVVELYPRALKRIELEVIKRVPLMGDAWRIIERKYRKNIVSFRNISYGGLDAYLHNIDRIISRCDASVIVIPPLPHPPEFETRRSPGYVERIRHIYDSELISDNFDNDFFDCFAQQSDLMCEDGHHLSVTGHRKLAEKIGASLERFFKRS